MPFLLRAVFLLGDFIFLNASVFLSFWSFDVPFFGSELSNNIYLLVFSNIAWLFLILVSNPYSFTRNSGIQRVFKSQLSFLFVHLLVVASLVLLFKKEYQPLQIIYLYLIFVPVFFGWKIFAYYLYSITIKKIDERRAIIIGQDEMLIETKGFLASQGELNVIQVFHYPVLNLEALNSVRTYCGSNSVDEIYCTFNRPDGQLLKELINFGLNNLIRVRLVSNTESFKKTALDQAESMLLDISTVPLDDYINRAAKRLFDLVISGIVTITVLSWLVPLIGLVIKLDSPGSIFFVQQRTGRNNMPFWCLKFRTMIVNTEADSKQATRDDARITRVGAFLRKSSLDEFPQFINVLIGNMSIIGPRPHPIKLNEKFAPLIEALMSRHYIKPGITGLAQAMGYRGETKEISDMRSRIKLDRFYIENWTMMFDIKIIFQTIFSLIRGGEKVF